MTSTVLVDRMRTASPLRLVPAMAGPTVVGLLASMLYQLMNTYFVSRLGVEATAAVVAVFPITMVVTAVAQGLGVGLSSAVSRRLGEGTGPDVNDLARTGLVVGVLAVLSLAIVLAAGIGLGGLTLVGVTPDNMADAVRYALPVLAGCTLMTVNILGGFLARAEGNTRFSMITQLVAFVANLVLDPVLIFVVGLGVAGAGFATLIAQAFAVVLYARFFWKGSGQIRPWTSGARVRLSLLRSVVAVGVPSSLGLFLGSLTISYLNHVAAGYSAQHVVAAGVAIRLYLLGLLVVTGFCMGSQGLLGYTIGQGNWARLRRILCVLLGYVLGVAALIAVVVWLVRDPIAGMFGQDALVRELIAGYLPAMYCGLPAVAAVIVAMSLFQAYGRIWFAMGMTMLRNGVLLVPALTLMTSVFGARGIAAGQLVSDLSSGVIASGFLVAQLRVLAGRAAYRDMQRI